MKVCIFTVVAFFWLTTVLAFGSDFFSSSRSENDLDPSKDFFSEHTSEEMDTPNYRSSDYKFERKDKPNKQYNIKEDLRYKAYLARFINIFLRSAGFSNDVFEDEIKTVRADLTLSKEDFIILEKFVNGEDISLESLENSFRKMFTQKPKLAKTVYSEFPIMEYLKYAILTAILLAVLMYVILMFRKLNFTISAISFIILIAYISVVLQALLKQYEDISENIIMRRMEFDHSGTPPKQCIYSKMSYLEKIYVHIFKDDTCQRFLQSRKSVWYEMDLVSAAIKPFTSIFSALCSMLGEGSEKLIKPFIDRSPWPINIMLELVVTIMQLPLLFVSIFVIFFALTSRTIYLKIPYLLSIAAEKKTKMNNDHSSKGLMEENTSHSSGSSIKTYVVNHGGVVLLGNDDKQIQSYSIQGSNSSQSFQISQQDKGYSIPGSSSSNLNSLSQPFQISQLDKDSYVNRAVNYSEGIKLGSIVNKQLAIYKREVRREFKKLTHYKKTNFKPNKRNIALKVVKENLDTLPVYES